MNPALAEFALAVATAGEGGTAASTLRTRLLRVERSAEGLVLFLILVCPHFHLRASPLVNA